MVKIKNELNAAREYLCLRDWKFLKYLFLKDLFWLLRAKQKHEEYINKYFIATSITKVRFDDFSLFFSHRMTDHAVKGIAVDRKEYFDIKDFIPRKHQIIFDVGANIGEYSLICSKLVGVTGRVIAIEPFPESFRLLVKNIELNKAENIIPINAAASDTDGTALLHISNDPLSASLTRIKESRPYIATVKVKSIKLDTIWDTICRKNSIYNRSILLKIDVEGGNSWC